ncbi:hypothetical protein PTMSG1_05299 [Pyrenophora teres f. maculata]|nr:hypothetical protein PTMSG1_05299 [Pyrenophora teres f. maculata]
MQPFALNLNGGERPEPEGMKAAFDQLSPMLHSRLLRGDYEGASETWGQILRLAGRPVDALNHGRSGLDAEKLVRRNPFTPNETSQNNPQQHSEIGALSEHGFDLVREYYGHVITNYPHKPSAPYSIDERTFYPHMFSLCIFEVCEKGKRAKSRLQDEVAVPSPSSRSTFIDSIHDEQPDDLYTKNEAIQREELAGAIQIAERLDEIISTLPSQHHAGLLQLRSDINVWITHLSESIHLSSAESMRRGLHRAQLGHS